MIAVVPLTRIYGNDEDRWRAVTARDRSRDGSFVYAVTSTGIFCRPSCASRRPRRERVRFFDGPDDAAQAGFRACLRCRPLEPATDPWVAKVARACADIARAEAAPPLAQLARRAGSSPYHFLRNFKRIVGVTPRAYADARRFDAVRRELRARPDVTSAFLEAGYGSSRSFYEGASPRLAMTPAAYRAGGEGQVIRYAVATSPIGRVLVAATPRGVCAVTLGDGETALVRGLRAEFPKAVIRREPSAVRVFLQQVLDHLRGDRARLDLPLDVQATAFQRQVWDALRAIPRGETRSYAEVAAAIGRPSAARAVARACATNPVALAVPCHRVTPAGGGPGGYRWGTKRKAALLAREGRTRPTSAPEVRGRGVS